MFFFDREINGCFVHKSGIKPPQCWIYPTNFSNPENKEIQCKKITGWKIIDETKAKEAGELLKKYIEYCESEANKEQKAIIERINEETLKKKLAKIPPSHLGGFKDTWNEIKILPAEGLSLQMKKFCNEFNAKCDVLKSNFLECLSICKPISNELIYFLQKYLLKYIKNAGIDVNGHYPLFKLFKFLKL